MHHAVGALLVIAGAVTLPLGLFHQFLEGRDIAFAKEIAGTLPAEDVARRVAPRRALVGLIAGKEVEKQRGLIERPSLAAAAAFENLAEELLRARPVEEVLLIGGALVGIARRDRDALDAHFLHLIEEVGDLVRLGAVEERAVDVGAEAALLRDLESHARRDRRRPSDRPTCRASPRRHRDGSTS